MAYPSPNKYFHYVVHVSAPVNGAVRTSEATADVGSADVYDNVGNDDRTQLGDVSGDTYTAYFPATGIKNTPAHFVGATPDGKSFVGYYFYHGKNNYYLYTNNTYNRNARVPFTAGKEFTVCYVAGTLIRTVKGDVAVERLAVGDVVVTASGAERPIKWLGHRAYSGRLARSNPDLLPVCVKAGALADGVPARDLWVSSKHAMAIDGVLVPAEHLVNGVSIVRAERVDTVEYWHVELGSHDVLLAEGAPSESFVDDNGRGIFHNAHTFHAMYPDEKRVEAIYCAPRVEDGYVLDAIRRRLAERAGLAVPPMLALGALRGALDVCDGTMIQGWAQDLAYPDAPVCLDVLVDGARVAIVYAEHLRRDLRQAGIGDGYHAFSLRLAAPLSPDVAHRVEVRRSADGMIVGAATLEAPPAAIAAA